MMKILKGNIIYTKEKEEFTVYENSYIVIDDKTVVGVHTQLPSEYEGIDIIDYKDSIIIPSFIDLHVHAPQFMQTGIGLNLELIDWLNQYTFLLEQRFEDVNYAKKVYPYFADSLYRNGTLRSVVYGTIHNEGTDVLVDCIKEKGLSAYVGKVNMNQNAPDNLMQTSEVSLNETREFILKHYNDDKVKPIITPRFAPSCTSDLLQGLGELSVELGVPIQSHLSENISEIEWVKEVFPESKDYSSVYEDHKLYGEQKTLMAHAIYLTDEEIEMAKNDNVYLVHCPNSNMNISSGVMPVTKYLDLGLQLGMGSDVGGGHRIAMNSTIVSALQCSKLLYSLKMADRILLESEAFYMCTKMNGKFFGKVGSFEEGYLFDALVIKDDSPLMVDLTPLEQLQRFLYCGKPEHIKARFLEGKKI